MVANRRTPPPPLQLEDNNARYGREMLQSRVAEKESFFSQLYHTDWRKLIIIVASINLIRYLFSALLIALSFRDLEKVDNSLHSKKRTAIFTAVGLMYVLAGLGELYGIVSIAMRRLRLIRIYVHMAFVSALAMTGTGVLVAYAYFEFAEDVVNQCVSIANSGKIVVKLLYRNSKSPNNAVFTPEDAQMQCFKAWSSESSSQILYVFAFYFLPSAFTCLLVYIYYRQCTDPYHSSSLCSQMPNANYTRVPRADGVVSPYFSPSYVVGSNGVNSRCDSRSGGNRRRSAQGPASGKRSARRAKVNWFSRMPAGNLNYSRLSLNSNLSAGISPGLPSYTGAYGHLGYEIPGNGLNSANSEGKYA